MRITVEEDGSMRKEDLLKHLGELSNALRDRLMRDDIVNAVRTSRDER